MYKGKHSVKNRIMLFFLVIMLLPIIILDVFTNRAYSRIIEKNVNEHTGQMINQIERNIESYLQSVENIVMYISELPEVIEYISDEDNLDDSNLEIKLKKSLNVYRDINPEILGILIVNTNDKYISNELEKINRDPLENEKWYIESIKNPGKAQYFSNPIGRNINSNLKHSADDVLSISKAIINDKTEEILGVILIDINLKKFEEIIKGNYIGEKGFFYILDKNNDIVYSPVNPIIYRIKRELLNEKSDSIVKEISNESFKIMYDTSDKTGWKTIGVFSLKDILSDVSIMKNIAIIIIILTLCLAIFSAIVFTNSIVRPIKELNRLMKRAELGDLDLRFDEREFKDEFGELGHSFNHMIKEIKELIDMVYKEQRSKRKAEIKILQAQIKPHFLYNTLDTIGWMAEEYGAKDIVEIVYALTKVFRIGLNKGREVINVSEEIEHINSYMIIQKVRYEDKLDYDINYDENLKYVPMLKLTTQPIVENAIYHGIKQKRGKGNISINFTEVDNNLVIKISDNGAGIDEDKLNEINAMLESDNISSITSENGSGYGIYNVNSRIKLTYGNQYGLKYFSEINKGTMVEIIIPILNE